MASGYPISFYNNGGKGTPMVQNPPAMPGVAVALTLNTYTKAGYDFVRWNSAANGQGNTNYSDGKVVTFTSGTSLYAVWVAVVKPGAPAKPNVTAGLGQVTVTVAAGTKGGVPKSYTVNATTTTAGATAGSCTVTGVSGSCDVTGLTNGATYTVSATATNNGGTSGANAALKTVTLLGAPADPMKPTVVAGNDKVTVTMAAATTGFPAASYTVTAYKPGSVEAGTCKVETAAGSCDVTGLAPGTAYAVKATATNAAGTSLASAETATVTLIMAPGQPGIGAVSSIALTTATVTFTAPSSDGGSPITSYTATSSPAGGTGTVSQAGNGQITVTGLTAGPYKFTVTATNAAGTSAPSAESTSVSTTLAVGSTGPGGGKVFYVSTTGFTSTGSACGTSCHYLEAQTTALRGNPWCSDITHAVSGAWGTAIGTGYSNTGGMSTGCTSGAWKAPWESTSGGVSDWYLPSSDELIALSAAGGLSNGFGYWSSTQVSSPYVAEGAYALTLKYGESRGAPSAKNDGWWVLAVRAF